MSSGGGWAAGRGSCLATATASGPIAARQGRSLLGSWRTKNRQTTPTCHQTPPTFCQTPPSSPLIPPTSTPPSPRTLACRADWTMGSGTRCWRGESRPRGRSSTCWSGRGQRLIRTSHDVKLWFLFLCPHTAVPSKLAPDWSRRPHYPVTCFHNNSCVYIVVLNVYSRTRFYFILPFHS